MGKGSRVGLLMPNGPDWLVAWLAIVRIGAVAVPINTFFKARELGWMLRHADVAVLLTAAGFLSHDYLARLEEIAPDEAIVNTNLSLYYMKIGDKTSAELEAAKSAVSQMEADVMAAKATRSPTTTTTTAARTRTAPKI